jgi:hypothetical protein
MRWCETTSRILLILSIVNFALAAPVAVREIHEVRVNMADVAKDGTGVSHPQTRDDPWTQWSTTNAADRTSAPPSPAGGLENALHGFAQLPPGSPATSSVASSNSRPGSPMTPTTPNNAPWNPESPESYDTPYQDGDPSWDSSHMTLSQQWLVDEPATPSSVNGPPPTQNAPQSSPPPSAPPSTDGRPPQSPGTDGNPPPSPELQRPVEHESESFLESLLKGKIRRHISSPVAVYSTRRELQGTIDPTTYVAASLPLLPTLTRSESLNISFLFDDFPFNQGSCQKNGFSCDVPN